MLTSLEYERKIQTDIRAAQKILELLPKKERVNYSMAGIATDSLAEILAAFALSSIADNGEGKDLICGVEVKYATITVYSDGVSRNVYANISNLKNKTGDLLIVVADTQQEIGDVVLRFFMIPFKIWKNKIKGNKLSMSFGSDRWKWYMDYEYTWEELQTRKKGLEVHYSI